MPLYVCDPSPAYPIIPNILLVVCQFITVITSKAGMDSLAGAENAGNKKVTGATETKMENAAIAPPPPDGNGGTCSQP